MIFNRESDRLFVSFRQRLNKPGKFDDPRPVSTFVRAGYAHLHLQSRWNDWYINSETEALEQVLGELTEPYGRAVAMGFSMGGYAALRFADALGLDHVLAISPQFSIHPDVLPYDTRYHHHAGEFDLVMSDLTINPRRGLKGAILADPFKPEDLVNAQMIQALYPGMGIGRLCGAGHPASRVLRAGGHFGAIQKQLISGQVNISRLCQLHRQSRRESALYWGGLARAARKSKRWRLFRTAKARADALLPPSAS